LIPKFEDPLENLVCNHELEVVEGLLQQKGGSRRWKKQPKFFPDFRI